MDSIIKVITDIVSGSGEAVLGLGWLLFLLERYYVYPKREQRLAQSLKEKEKQYRDDINRFSEDYKALGENLTQALAKFHTLLEVIKDRMR